ncbi:MAG: CoB--CoM heterodisulfide reductase iron-sulfur subunit A family protein [bacterium]
MSAKKIGAYICDCKDFEPVDLPSLRDFVFRIPNVADVKVGPPLCRAGGADDLRAWIEEAGVECIALGGCSPLMCEGILRSALGGAGLNEYLYSIANLREQCALVHPDVAEATEKAKALMRAACYRAGEARPIEGAAFSLKRGVLVIGGGISGLQCALKLADMGLEVTLVERGDKVGGWVGGLSGIYVGEFWNKGFIPSIVLRVSSNPKISVITSAEVVGLKGDVGDFEAKILAPGGESKVWVGAIVVATGCGTEFPSGSYGLPLGPSVVTFLDFERLLRERKVPPSVCFVLDLVDGGSNKLLSASALKGALEVVDRLGGEAYVLYKNMKVSGAGLEQLFDEARERGVVFFCYRDPPELSVAGREAKVTVKSPLLSSDGVDRRFEIRCEMLVLGEAFVPGEAPASLGKILDVRSDAGGFFQDDTVRLAPVGSNREGIYFVGTSRYPRDVEESLSDADAVASEIYRLLKVGKKTIDPVRAEVDSEKCAICLTCIRTCPHRAIRPRANKDVGKVVAFVNELACRGCGICAGECPAKAIQLRYFSDAEILAEVEGGLWVGG